MAALKEVTEPTKLAGPTSAVGLTRSTVDPGARRLTTERPEASRSGLIQPSTEVGPTLLKAGDASSVAAAVPLSSRAPTVMTRGSSPGARIVPLNGPALPAEATTTMPTLQADSTALSRGLSMLEVIGTWPSDRLRTRMLSEGWLATTHWMPLSTVARSVAPLTPATFTETSPAPGASP